MITVLVTPEELARATVTIRGDSYRHLFRSRRLAVGDGLRLVDGGGIARWGTIARVGPKEGEISVGEGAPAHEPAHRVQLLVAAPRFQRASWLVEKVTELGVAEICFLASDRAPRSYGKGNLERLQRVAAGALQQCHGSRLPSIRGICPFDEIPSLAQGSNRLIVLDPPSEGGAGTAIGQGTFTDTDPEAATNPITRVITLAIGPEGGWSPEERLQLLEWGFVARCLGVRVLRVETAAIVGAAAALGLA